MGSTNLSGAYCHFPVPEKDRQMPELVLLEAAWIGPADRIAMSGTNNQINVRRVLIPRT